MHRADENTTIATITDLRRRTTDILARADEGGIVVVQRDNEPHGVYLSYRHYESMLEMIDRLENRELATVAVPRREAVARGEMETTSFADMVAEFAPELRDA
ncbi:MAG TPA: type II toxin-antitoxin system prevent-host-death family antitoxin [Longimicrobium sp.]|jgi:prevent-host-death family protein